MPSPAAKQDTRTPDTAPPQPLDFTAAETFLRTGQNCARACLEWQQELIRFATARWLADAQLPLSAASCRDVGDLVALQQQWVAKAIEDYSAEAAQLMQIADRVARESPTSWPEVEEEASAEAESTKVIA